MFFLNLRTLDSMGAIGRGIWAWFHAFQIRFHHRKLRSRHPTVTLFRPTPVNFKPSRVSQAPLELFYRSRPIKVAFQIALGIFLVLWTVKNYWEVFKNF